MHRQYPPYTTQVSENKTASRLLNTQYINSTGRTMFVHTSVRCTTPLIGDRAVAWFTPRVATISAVVGYLTGVMPATYFAMPGVVRPGDRYQVTTLLTGTGTVTLNYWFESY